jgi:hypothetical protein
MTQARQVTVFYDTTTSADWGGAGGGGEGISQTGTEGETRWAADVFTSSGKWEKASQGYVILSLTGLKASSIKMPYTIKAPQTEMIKWLGWGFGEVYPPKRGLVPTKIGHEEVTVNETLTYAESKSQTVKHIPEGQPRVVSKNGVGEPRWNAANNSFDLSTAASGAVIISYTIKAEKWAVPFDFDDIAANVKTTIDGASRRVENPNPQVSMPIIIETNKGSKTFIVTANLRMILPGSTRSGIGADGQPFSETRADADAAALIDDYLRNFAKDSEAFDEAMQEYLNGEGEDGQKRLDAMLQDYLNEVTDSGKTRFEELIDGYLGANHAYTEISRQTQTVDIPDSSGGSSGAKVERITKINLKNAAGIGLELNFNGW